MNTTKHPIVHKFYAATHKVMLFASILVVSVFTAFAQTNEGFEGGGKGSYAAGNVTLSSGSWYLDEALTGNLVGDVKLGSYASRVRGNSGKVRMNFNVANAGTVAVSYAIYGSDSVSNWELWKSTDNGSNWSQVGSTITDSTTSLKTAYFAVNSAVPIRFEIRKVSGGTSNRLNFDDISLADDAGSSSVHLTMGNPSDAVTNTLFPSNYLMEKDEYVLSYHRYNGGPNWVSWHLDTSWLGSAPRQDDFRGDSTLPGGWYKVVGSSYSGSGYDRGHMCPSADRTLTEDANSETFLMTNMLPQTADNNRVTWEDLESYSRTQVNSHGKELYIIAGGYGNAGTINSGNVLVPTHTWKVIMVLDAGSNDVSRVTASTRLIAIWVPNEDDIDNDWEDFRVSVDYVEAMTGYDFFSNVSDATENTIESVVDTL